MKKRSIVIIILIVTIFIIITTFIYLYFSPYIKLNGKKTVILNVFDTYKENGKTYCVLKDAAMEKN